MKVGGFGGCPAPFSGFVVFRECEWKRIGGWKGLALPNLHGVCGSAPGATEPNSCSEPQKLKREGMDKPRYGPRILRSYVFEHLVGLNFYLLMDVSGFPMESFTHRPVRRDCRGHVRQAPYSRVSFRKLDRRIGSKECSMWGRTGAGR